SRAAKREAETADVAGQTRAATDSSMSAAAAPPAGHSAQVSGSSEQGEALSRSAAGSRSAGASATDSTAAAQTDRGKTPADKTGETFNRLLAAKKRRQK
ncbi:MAG: hypothetical protein ACOYIL_02810, partial [Brevibacillus sp.]